MEFTTPRPTILETPKPGTLRKFLFATPKFTMPDHRCYNNIVSLPKIMSSAEVARSKCSSALKGNIDCINDPLKYYLYEYCTECAIYAKKVGYGLARINENEPLWQSNEKGEPRLASEDKESCESRKKLNDESTPLSFKHQDVKTSETQEDSIHKEELKDHVPELNLSAIESALRTVIKQDENNQSRHSLKRVSITCQEHSVLKNYSRQLIYETNIKHKPHTSPKEPEKILRTLRFNFANIRFRIKFIVDPTTKLTDKGEVVKNYLNEKMKVINKKLGESDRLYFVDKDKYPYDLEECISELANNEEIFILVNFEGGVVLDQNLLRLGYGDTKYSLHPIWKH